MRAILGRSESCVCRRQQRTDPLSICNFRVPLQAKICARAVPASDIIQTARRAGINGRLPKRGSAGAVGYDLFSSAEAVIPARCVSTLQSLLQTCSAQAVRCSCAAEPPCPCHSICFVAAFNCSPLPRELAFTQSLFLARFWVQSQKWQGFVLGVDRRSNGDTSRMLRPHSPAFGAGCEERDTCGCRRGRSRLSGACAPPRAPNLSARDKSGGAKEVEVEVRKLPSPGSWTRILILATVIQGEVKVLLFNLGDVDFEAAAGSRVAQVGAAALVARSMRVAQVCAAALVARSMRVAQVCAAARSRSSLCGLPAR
jgi:dUTPase